MSFALTHVNSGIWDCLSSQQVVDIVRSQAAEGKDLAEICEMICDHCLAPDTTSGAGIGCDNMTVLIVAITHGRTKEEWYEWVKERVKTEHGYKTPDTLPQLYSQSRLLSFRARREAQEARERLHASNSNEPTQSAHRDEFLRRHGLTVTTFSAEGISHRPGCPIVSDSGNIMFGNDESDEEDSAEEEVAGSRSYFSDTLGLANPTKDLKEQLAEYEKGEEASHADVDADGDANMRDLDEALIGVYSY